MKAILDQKTEDLYHMYLNRRFNLIEEIVQSSRISELKQFARDNSLPWHGGSKASFLQALRISFAHRRVIIGEAFR